MLNSNVTGIPTILSAGANSASYVGANSFAAAFSLGTGPNFAYIYNLRLLQNGLVYIIIGNNAIWPRSPVISQIKTGSGPNGLPPAYFRVLSYKTSDSSSGNMAWTSMTSGTYTMYITFSDDNPFDNANFGPISSYSLAIEVAAWQTFIITNLLGLLLLIML